jgi:integrase/recombinase XerD
MHASSKPRPRLIALRHTLAVRGLETCPATRDQVGRSRFARTTSREHVKVESTYWYLESTPELLIDIPQRCQSRT